MPDALAAIKRALAAGRTVDIDAAVTSDQQWEDLEEFLGKMTEESLKGAIVLCVST